MGLRSVVLIGAGAVAVAIGGAAIAAAVDDPEMAIESVTLSGEVTAAGPGAPPVPATVPEIPPVSRLPGVDSGGTDDGAGAGAGADGGGSADTRAQVTVQEVEGLEQLVGTLRAGDDPDDWYVSGVDVDFGPDGWISAAPASADYDRDGTVASLLEELRSLEGREVTLGVRYDLDDDRDDAYVYTIDGLVYRDPAGGPPPWETRPDGEEATRDEIAAIAAAAVGEGAEVDWIGREDDDGWHGWDVDVYTADGRKYEVYVDLAGTVVDVRPDTD